MSGATAASAAGSARGRCAGRRVKRVLEQTIDAHTVCALRLRCAKQQPKDRINEDKARRCRLVAHGTEALSRLLRVPCPLCMGHESVAVERLEVAAAGAERRHPDQAAAKAVHQRDHKLVGHDIVVASERFPDALHATVEAQQRPLSNLAGVLRVVELRVLGAAVRNASGNALRLDLRQPARHQRVTTTGRKNRNAPQRPTSHGTPRLLCDIGGGAKRQAQSKFHKFLFLVEVQATVG
jgi:hypothetical protein